GKLIKASDRLKPNVALQHLLPLVAKEFLKQSHQGSDLGLGTRPIFAGEGVCRYIFNTKFPRSTDHLTYRLCPLLVAFDAGETPFLCPTAIPVHDDRDMPWNPGQP